MHNSQLSPGPYGRDFENCSWLVIEMEDMQLDRERMDSQAILIKNQWLGLHAANCRPKALECDMALSFLAHVTHEEVNQIARGDKTSGCKI